MYRIVWENEFEATDPLAAAKEAREDIGNGESIMFTVEEVVNTHIPDFIPAKKFSVDLNEDDEDAVVEMVL